MIGSIQEILCLLLAAQTGVGNDGRGGNQRVHVGFSHCPPRTALRPTVQLLPCLVPWRLHRQKRLGVNAVLLVQGDPPQLQGPDTLDPALSFRKMPIRSNQLHFAVHHDQPISASFLDRRRGREKLNKEAGTIEGREVSYDLEYHRIRPSESFKQTCTSQVFSSLASQLSCGQLSRSNRQIRAMLLAKRRMILSSRISPDPRNQTNMKCAKA
jgi:hypothetical protein